jgi:hypothetical protein
MARLTVEQLDVVVRLEALEGLAAWRRELRVPLGCVRMVHVEEAPLAGLSLWRLPGLSWPGLFAVGSRTRDGVREFVAVRAGQPAIVLDAEGARWDRLVISHPDAVNVAAELAELLLGRGPGGGHHGSQVSRPGRQHGPSLYREKSEHPGPGTRNRAGVGAACRLL